MKAKDTKTNVMRVLEQAGIAYTPHAYAHEEGAVDGVTVAALTGLAPESVYKTLVTVGASKQHFVFVIPVAKELDLKKAAKAAGEKSIAMLHVAELLALTGYVRGGCSPIGMKKKFPTFFAQEISDLPTVAVSAGKIGAQVELAPADLLRAAQGSTADLCK